MYQCGEWAFTSVFWKKLKDLYERKMISKKLYLFKKFKNLKFKEVTCSYVGCKETRKPTTKFVFIVGDDFVSWMSKTLLLYPLLKSIFLNWNGKKWFCWNRCFCNFGCNTRNTLCIVLFIQKLCIFMFIQSSFIFKRIWHIILELNTLMSAII